MNEADKRESPSAAIMSVWETLSWIAFKQIRPRSDLDDRDFVLRWGHSNAAPVLEALEARAAPAPFCVVQAVLLDDAAWDGNAYAHKAWSRDGPRMLRWIRARARQREGRLVTYAELATRLRDELENADKDGARIDGARRELLEALRASRLTAWGKLDTRQGQANPAAQYEAIPASAFIDELVSVTEWGTVGADPEHPTAIYNYRGRSFRDVRFYSSEVTDVWPAMQSAKRADVVPSAGDEMGRSRGGRPAQHDWDRFWIELVLYAAANDIGVDDRLNLQRHMENWTAEHWQKPPDPSTIRTRLKRLFDAIEAARK